jgi:hypothetical protein
VLEDVERAAFGAPRRQQYTETQLTAAVAQHGGCRAAGRALGLSHSTISRATRRLRDADDTQPL